MFKEKVNSMGKRHRKNAKIHKALKRYDEAQERAQKEGVPAVSTPIPALQPLADHPGVGGLHEQLLTIMETAGHRAGEVAGLITIALFFQNLGRYEQAKEVYMRSLNIARQANDFASESTALHMLAELQYRCLGATAEGIETMEQAITTLHKASLARDLSGFTVEHLEALLQMMRDNVNGIVDENTFALQQHTLNTFVAEELTWRRERMLGEVQATRHNEANKQMGAELNTALIALLDGQNPNPDLSANELLAGWFSYIKKAFSVFNDVKPKEQ